MSSKNKHRVDMKVVRSDGIWTYLGVMTAGSLNVLMTYSLPGKH